MYSAAPQREDTARAATAIELFLDAGEVRLLIGTRGGLLLVQALDGTVLGEAMAHQRGVTALSVSGTVAMSAGVDGSISWWSLPQLEHTRTVRPFDEPAVWLTAVAAGYPSGRIIYITEAEPRVALTSPSAVTPGRLAALFYGKDLEQRLTSLDVRAGTAHGSEFLCIAARGQLLALSQAKPNDKPRRIGDRLAAGATAIASFSDSRWNLAALGRENGHVDIINLDSGAVINEKAISHPAPVEEVRILATAIACAVVSRDTSGAIKWTTVDPPPVKLDARLLSDNLATEQDDRLGFKVYADAIVSLIDNPRTGTPLTIAINAPWGAGKSSLGRMIQAQLDQSSLGFRHVTCWFNAWMHDDAANLAGAFAAAIAAEANARRSWVRRHVRLLLAATFLTSAVAALAWTGVLSMLLSDLGLPVGLGFATLAYLAYLAIKNHEILFSGVKAVAAFVKEPTGTASTAKMADVRTQLAGLIAQATPPGSRFVIFVDDIERCRLPRAVDILEVVNQLLDYENVIVVLMADMNAVALAAQIKYEKLAAMPGAPGGRNGFGALYLQKMIQLQFDLPPHSVEAVAGMMISSVRTGEPGAEPAAEPQRPPVEAADPVPSIEVWRNAVHGGAPWRLKREFTEVLWNGNFSLRASKLALAALLLPIRVGSYLGDVIVRNSKSRSFPNRDRHSPATNPLASVYSTTAILALAASAVYIPFWAVYLASLAALALISTAVHAGRRRHRRDRADREMTEVIRSSGQDQATAIQERFSAQGYDLDPQLLRRELRRNLADDSTIRREAESAISQHIRANPRLAKRTLNQLRLALLIANERGLFGPNSPVAPAHVSRWAVICDRWPNFANKVRQRPELMAELETKPIEESHADPELYAFLKSGYPPAEAIPFLTGLRARATEPQP